MAAKLSLNFCKDMIKERKFEDCSDPPSRWLRCTIRELEDWNNGILESRKLSGWSIAAMGK